MAKKADKLLLSDFLFISGGDPASIAPEIIRKSLLDLSDHSEKLKILYFFNASKKEKEKLILELNQWDVFVLKNWEDLPIFLTIANQNKKVLILYEIANYNYKKPSLESAKLSYETLQIACKKIKAHHCKGLVTAPVSKYWIQKLDPHFTGHTGYLANFFKKTVVMILYSDYFSVLPVTEHVAIKKVSKEFIKRIQSEEFLKILQNLHKKKIFKKKWVFLGFNPHCGENGHIGVEEIRYVIPFIKKLKSLNIKIEGPISSDSFFMSENLRKYDLIIGGYHDQVLIPFKMIAQLDGINITFGLPFLRTSPDHGTAYDIAFKDKADFRSMRNAILFHYQKKWN
ncbi:MAG: PdxA family protein [Leptonema sp. (in: bacteria)]